MQIELLTEIIHGIGLLPSFPLDSVEDLQEEVTAEHPEVLAMIEETVKTAKGMNFQQPYEKHAEILEEVLKEVRDPGCLFLSLI